jgi:hypothetical protein
VVETPSAIKGKHGWFHSFKKIRRNSVQGKPRQKVRPISTNKLDIVTYTCHPNYTGGIEQEAHGLRQPRQKHKTLPEK